MRTEDLKLLFKDVSFKPEDIKSYIIDLLSKFEVALMWDEHNLLIPSLLPTEQDLRIGLPQMDIRVSDIEEFLFQKVQEFLLPIISYCARSRINFVRDSLVLIGNMYITVDICILLTREYSADSSAW